MTTPNSLYKSYLLLFVINWIFLVCDAFLGWWDLFGIDLVFMALYLYFGYLAYLGSR